MKKQNSNKKRKFTFNAIDALIILLIVALIALTVYFFILGKDAPSKSNNDTNQTNTNEEAQPTASTVYIESQTEVYLA